MRIYFDIFCQILETSYVIDMVPKKTYPQNRIYLGICQTLNPAAHILNCSFYRNKSPLEHLALLEFINWSEDHYFCIYSFMVYFLACTVIWCSHFLLCFLGWTSIAQSTLIIVDISLFVSGITLESHSPKEMLFYIPVYAWDLRSSLREGEGMLQGLARDSGTSFYSSC